MRAPFPGRVWLAVSLSMGIGLSNPSPFLPGVTEGERMQRRIWAPGLLEDSVATAFLGMESRPGARDSANLEPGNSNFSGGYHSRLGPVRIGGRLSLSLFGHEEQKIDRGLAEAYRRRNEGAVWIEPGLGWLEGLSFRLTHSERIANSQVFDSLGTMARFVEFEARRQATLAGELNLLFQAGKGKYLRFSGGAGETRNNKDSGNEVRFNQASYRRFISREGDFSAWTGNVFRVGSDFLMRAGTRDWFVLGAGMDLKDEHGPRQRITGDTVTFRLGAGWHFERGGRWIGYQASPGVSAGMSFFNSPAANPMTYWGFIKPLDEDRSIREMRFDAPQRLLIKLGDVFTLLLPGNLSFRNVIAKDEAGTGAGWRSSTSRFEYSLDSPIVILEPDGIFSFALAFVGTFRYPGFSVQLGIPL